VAALGSYLEAKSHGGQWLGRMEDVDEPRSQAGAADDILRALETFGFEWDGAVLVQSRRGDAYRTALEQLRAADCVYPCGCTRRELALLAVTDSDNPLLAQDGAAIYPGACRNGLPPGKAARAWRLRAGDEEIAFDDAIQGRFSQNLSRDVGDFVLLRADGFFAYQLAVVVDDAEQGVNAVVRGADLLDSTPRQILLQRLLGLPTPQYAHLPVAVDANGEKLSKQTLALPVNAAQPVPALLAALRFLGQALPPEPDRENAGLDEVWRWALRHWRLENVPQQRSLPAQDL